MIQKHFYEAPEAEILIAKFERNILSNDGQWDNSIRPGTSWNGDAPEGYYGLD